MNSNKVSDSKLNETTILMDEIPKIHGNEEDRRSRDSDIRTSRSRSLPIKRRPSFFLEAGNRLVPRPTYGSDDTHMFSNRNRGSRYDDDSDDYMDMYDNYIGGQYGRPSINSGSLGSNIFDVNVYQQKKTLAQGMMDLALISANANQLRYVMQYKSHPFHYISLAMIVASLLLQVIVGIGLIWNSRYDVKEDEQIPKANKTNNWTVVGIFLVTILNVFISSFGVTEEIEGGDDVYFSPRDKNSSNFKTNVNDTKS